MKALIWKEWREQRIFLLMAVGILICINISSIIYLNIPSETVSPIYKLDKINDFNFWVGWTILPALFALILGAIPFGRELSNNTQDFLLQRPISTAKIFWLKFFFGFFLLLFIIQLCHLFLHVPHSLIREQISADIVDYSTLQYFVIFYLVFYLLFILAYSASFFSSFLVKKDLLSMVFSIISIGIGILYIIPLFLILLIILSPSQLSSLFVDETIHLFTMSILFMGFIIFSFILWQKAISKGIKTSKIFFNVTGIIFAVYFVAHTTLNISTGIELSKTLKQAKADGMKMTLEEIIPPPVPDEENAAFIYEKAFGLVNKLKRQYKDEWEYMPYESPKITLEELTLEQKRTIAKLLLEDEDFIKLYQLIEKAINFSKCRFYLNYEVMPLLLYPQWIRQLANLVAAHTYILTEEKRYKEAWESSLIGLKIGESLKDEPTLISQLVRIAVNGITAGSLQPIINIYPKEISINDYQKLILEIDKKEREITKGLEIELAFTGNLVFKNLLKGNVEKLYEIGLGQGSVPEKFLLIFYSFIGRPLLKQDYAFYVRSLTEVISLSRLPYSQAKDKLSELERKVKTGGCKLKYPLSAMLIPALTRAQIVQARDNAQLDGLKIACALKIYRKQNGYYPDELTSLVPDVLLELPLDPFTGKNFIYRKEGEGFIVYSLGPNEKDDSGISQKENNEIQKEKESWERDNDAYDIIWKCKE